MHPSVMDFLHSEVSPEEIRGKELLEVGSQNVNGSPREVLECHAPAKYVGVDFAAGPGVDVVADVSELVSRFGVESFDVVVSTEMLEHAYDWRIAVQQMKTVLRPGGLLVVTTRSPGFPYHGYPHDYWRYTVKNFEAIFADTEISTLVSDPLPGHPGVLMKARKRANVMPVDLDTVRVLPVVH